MPEETLDEIAFLKSNFFDDIDIDMQFKSIATFPVILNPNTHHVTNLKTEKTIDANGKDHKI